MKAVLLLLVLGYFELLSQVNHRTSLSGTTCHKPRKPHNVCDTIVRIESLKEVSVFHAEQTLEGDEIEIHSNLFTTEFFQPLWLSL